MLLDESQVSTKRRDDLYTLYNLTSENIGWWHTSLGAKDLKEVLVCDRDTIQQEINSIICQSLYKIK